MQKQLGHEGELCTEERSSRKPELAPSTLLILLFAPSLEAVQILFFAPGAAVRKGTKKADA